LDSYGLHLRDSQMDCMVVCKSDHSVWSFHRGSSLGCSCATSSLWRCPCRFSIGCSEFPSTAATEASYRKFVGSLVCDVGCWSLPSMWWSWLVPAGSLRVLGEWYGGGDRLPPSWWTHLSVAFPIDSYMFVCGLLCIKVITAVNLSPRAQKYMFRKNCATRKKYE
jgi:hypothetical protein